MVALGVVGPAMEDYVGALLDGSSGVKLSHEETALGQQLLSELKERLRQYEEAMAGLVEQKAELKQALLVQQADQKDVFEYLKAELLKKTDEVRALESRLAELREQSELQAALHEQAIQAATDKAELERAELNELVHTQKEALERVRRFQGRQESIEAELSEHKERLKREAQRHNALVSDLERKHVQEKDRLKKEMLMRLRETKANLLRMTDSHLDTTTKRTIAENEQMSSELAWQSRETEKLLDKNDKLSASNQSLRRELSIYEQTQKELTTKIHGYQKTIKALLSRLNNLDASQRAQMQAFQYEEEEQQREKAEDQQKIEALEDEVRRLQAQVEAAQGQARSAATMYEDMEKKHHRALIFQNDAVKFITRCLEDISEGVGQLQSGGSTFDHLTLSTLDASDRQRVMQYVGEQLQAYQQQLRELELQEQWQHHTTAGSSCLPPIMARSPAGGGGGQWSPAKSSSGGGACSTANGSVFGPTRTVRAR